MSIDVAIDPASLPPMLQRILATASPPALAMGLAKGAVPGLRPDQLLLGVYLLARTDFEHISPEIRAQAESTLQKPAMQIVDAALSSKEMHPAVLDALADSFTNDPTHLEKVLTHPAVLPDTIARIARKCDEMTSELIATNERLLLLNPAIIDALYLNKHTRMSTADRLLDLAVRNGVKLEVPAFREAAEAIAEQPIAAPSEHPTEIDVLFREVDEEAARIESEVADPHTLITETDDGDVVLEKKLIPLDKKLELMSISGRIRRAMIGTATERSLLIRSSNRLVAIAVVRSPLLTDNEVANFSSNRSLSSDILREIAANGTLIRSGQVKFNLVRNPKTPLATSLRLLSFLRADELKKIKNDKGVPGQVKRNAEQELGKKKH
jgi:hypothetical protein